MTTSVEDIELEEIFQKALVRISQNPINNLQIRIETLGNFHIFMNYCIIISLHLDRRQKELQKL